MFAKIGRPIRTPMAEVIRMAPEMRLIMMMDVRWVCIKNRSENVDAMLGIFCRIILHPVGHSLSQDLIRG